MRVSYLHQVAAWMPRGGGWRGKGQDSRAVEGEIGGKWRQAAATSGPTPGAVVGSPAASQPHTYPPNRTADPPLEAGNGWQVVQRPRPLRLGVGGRLADVGILHQALQGGGHRGSGREGGQQARRWRRWWVVGATCEARAAAIPSACTHACNERGFPAAAAQHQVASWPGRAHCKCQRTWPNSVVPRTIS